MSQAYGLVEMRGVTAAVNALDIMCKTSGVRLVTWERKMGAWLVTLIVEGSVSDCTEAVEAVCANTLAKPVSHGVIPAPHPAIVEMVEFSAERLKRQGRVRKEEEDQSYLQQV